ncbi:STAS-like domain-containing protein [Vacuolonema iberomarrocanum]|uniref:STAS-like domain-containing protein n=1 Tax=Vacuolonema iberomarrocanum TaxID=3454632 RepID=UPI0019DE02CB|nr:STAS-like domain-containing protein [filamentous cyanobacterium LEGE 07170]
MNYKIYDIAGEYATDADSGQRLYDLIHPQLRDGNTVGLDFSEVNVFASAFFNFAIGQLLKDISSDQLNKQLKITHLSPNGLTILKRVIDNAKDYYSDAHYQQAVETVLEEYAASF